MRFNAGLKGYTITVLMEVRMELEHFKVRNRSSLPWIRRERYIKLNKQNSKTRDDLWIRR